MTEFTAQYFYYGIPHCCYGTGERVVMPPIKTLLYILLYQKRRNRF